MTRRETDPSNRPKPKSRANMPVTIGFLTYLYGPVATNWGGGLDGTGVPRAFRKWRTDQPVKNKANKKAGKDKKAENGLGITSVIPSSLSSSKAKTMKTNINRP